MPSDTLTDAMRAIQQILTDYKVGGAILLANATDAEWLYHLPESSCVKIHDDGSIQISSHHAHYPSREAQKQHLEESIHVIYQLRDLGVQTATNLQQICRTLEQHFKIEYIPDTEG
jgi:hypothetical protein